MHPCVWIELLFMFLAVIMTMTIFHRKRWEHDRYLLITFMSTVFITFVFSPYERPSTELDGGYFVLILFLFGFTIRNFIVYLSAIRNFLGYPYEIPMSYFSDVILYSCNVIISIGCLEFIILSYFNRSMIESVGMRTPIFVFVILMILAMLVFIAYLVFSLVMHIKKKQEIREINNARKQKIS